MTARGASEGRPAGRGLGSLRPAASLLAPWLAACGPRLGDACEDGRSVGRTCVNLLVSGDLGELSRLRVRSMGAWRGEAEAAGDGTFYLPASLGVVLPEVLSGSVELEVRAYLGTRETGCGAVVLDGIAPREHRQVELPLRPGACVP